MDKGKVTAKVNPTNVVTLQAQSRPHSRPSSPFKTKTMPSEPASRIKAKVSSSATIVVGRTTSSSSTSNTENSIVKSTTRPPSPFKQPRAHTRKPSTSRSAIDVQFSRPKASLAPHELSRQRSLTSTLEPSLTGARRSGAASFHPTPPLSPSARLAPENPSTSPVIRVKAKVSGVARSHGLNASSTPASPSHPSSPPYTTTRTIESRPRAASITGLSIFNPKPPLSAVSTASVAVYPITTPTSAANPHRYAPRIPSNTASARFQSLSPLCNRDPDNGVHHVRISSKVDPAAIPLPPQSPPASTLSFSSQSSRDTQCSSVSGSTASTLNSHLQVTPLSAGSDVLDDICDPNSPRHSPDIPVAYADHLENSDRKVQAEAKTNRKIEDLKITNRSLLAINASLEATKHRQLTEIRELRRKLRESRLMLPPRTYRTLKSSLSPEDMADDEDIDDDSNNDDDGGDDEHDGTYKRIKGILEDLLETGRRALRAEPRDFEKQCSGVKVLSAEEVRSWRNNMGDDISSTHSAPTDGDTDDEHLPQRNPPTASQSAAGSENDSEKAPSRYHDEEAKVMGDDEQNATSLPPITVTFS